MLTEKQQKAWEEFKVKMVELKKRRSEILAKISKKIDEHHLSNLRRKLNIHE